MSKVKFGLSAFEYGIVNNEDKVPATKKLPGMKSAKLEITNELQTIMADDGPYAVLSGGTRTEDGKSIWVGLLKGKFTVPGMDMKTKEGAPDPTPDTTKGNFVARGDDETGDILYIGREDNTEFDFAEFKKMVFPTA